ncbi:hypothetical protein FB451DRAFT_1361983 [Mycena latifolia]|nr:hypothetical protein FB451DRAFT_1361983 [Mycena latifolia]
MASPSARPVAIPGALTPIRAITTPLRSSAAPPIPAAAQLYEPLAKAVLRRRLTARIFPATGLLCVLFAGMWLASIGRLSGSGVGVLGVLGAAAGMWLGAVLPVLLVRKAFLTVTRTSAPSPLLLLQKSLAPNTALRARTVRAGQAHLLSALSLLALHAALDPTLPVFIRSRKHPWTPHPALVLLALSQAALAALYVARAALRDVWVFPFRRPTLRPTPGALLAPLLLPLAAVPIALLALFVVLPLARRVPLLSLLLRPLRTPRPSVLREVGRAWALGAQTAGVWEAVGGLWGWGVGEPLRTTPSIRALVSGISVAVTPAPAPSAYPSSAGSSAFSSAFSTPASARASAAPRAPVPAAPPLSIYTHLAYAELLALCADDDEGDSTDGEKRRKRREGAFEADVWARLVREVLVLLGREYQVLKGRGVPASSAPAAASHPSAAASTLGGAASGSGDAKPLPTTPLLKTNIFAKQAKPSPGARVGDALAAGGAVEEVVAPTLESLPLPSLPLLPSMPSLAMTVPAWQAYVPTFGVEKYVGMVAKMGMPQAWTQVRRGREVVGWVPRREVVVEAVGVLTHLTCASLAEDRLGVVQRDIPRVVEALVEFLGAVEAAVGALRPANNNNGGEKEEREDKIREEQDLEEARAVLGDVGDALKEGLARIARTFGDKLRAFRFPPRTAARLQGFVDYCDYPNGQGVGGAGWVGWGRG